MSTHTLPPKYCTYISFEYTVLRNLRPDSCGIAVNVHSMNSPNCTCAARTRFNRLAEWRYGVVVTALGVSMRLLYVEPG